MIRKIFIPVILGLLTWGFWISPDFKGISAGVAIFLFGMFFLEKGFQAFTGGTLENLLRWSTNKLWKSMTFGIVSTTIMQSSSLVSVLTISFLGAGLLGLQAGLGIIFGANLGTTTGAWLVAAFGLKVKISAWAMPLLVFGIVLVFQKNQYLRGLGNVLAGVGFLFLGIHYMKEGFEAFREGIDLTRFSMSGIGGLFVYTGIGIIATVVMQSSHATLVLIITALASGQITYENSLALAIGANIGTTITALIGAVSSNSAGRRLAAGHLIFNMVTGVAAIAAIGQFAWMVNYISNATGIAADDHTMKLAVFHSLFNLAGVLLIIPFINPLGRFLETLYSEESLVEGPLYLNETALSHPDTAIKVISQETMHLYDNAFEILTHMLCLRRRDVLSSRDVRDILAEAPLRPDHDANSLYKEQIKGIFNAIMDFASRSQVQMEAAQQRDLFNLKVAARDIAGSIKNIAQVQQNMLLYTQSSNHFIREEYNALRGKMIFLFRLIEKIRHCRDTTELVLLINKMKTIRKGIDVLSIGLVDRLLREHLVTDTMATSLINDSSRINSIAKELIMVMDLVYIQTHSALKHLEDSVILTEHETDQLQVPDI
jgi:phosphate:Na+ symporter